MKRIIILFTALSFFSCKKSNKNISIEIERSFNSYLHNQEQSLGKDTSINKTFCFINRSRKDFLSKLKFDLNSDFNIIETYNMFTPDLYYQATIKKDSKVYCFVSGFKSKPNLEIKSFEKLKKEDPSRACLVYEAEKNIKKLVGEKIGDATFHFSIHLIKKVNGEILNYSPKNLCVLIKENNEVIY